MRPAALTRLLLLVALASACSSRTEVASQPRSSSGAVYVQAQPGASAQPVATNQCQLTLSVGPVQVRPGCTIDEHVSGQTAALSYPCNGGPTSVAIGGTSFVGGVTDGELDVSTETTFPFSDGCQWRTKQRISGRLRAGPLTYTYEERPDPGQRGCAAGCEATAVVQAY